MQATEQLDHATDQESRVPGVVGNGTVLAPTFSVDVRLGPTDHRVEIGSRCALECRISLERVVGSVTIGDNTFIGRSHIVCAKGVTIGADVLIAWGCTIIDHDSHSIRWEDRAEDIARWREGLAEGNSVAAATKDWQDVPASEVRICDKAWIGFNAIILKGVTIGEGAVIGAGSVVTRDVAAWTVAAGNPARTIKPVPRGKS